MLPTLVPFVPAAVAILSAALLAYALRGRRMDDHPLCRKCGFDLFGRPPTSTVCPECGADLTRGRAVRVGRRERRRGLIRVTLPLLVLSAGWLGLAGWDAARRTDWNRHKPLWWLMREVDGKSPAARDAALAELGRRTGEGRLPDGRLRVLVDKALAYQADTSQPWAPAWGAFVESAHDAKKVSREQWDRYAAQAVMLRLEPVDEKVGRGDPLHLRLVRGPDRVAFARFRVQLVWNRVVHLPHQDSYVSEEHMTGRTPLSDSAPWQHPTPYVGGELIYDESVSSKVTLDVPANPNSTPVGAPLASMVFDYEADHLDRLPDGPQTARVRITIRPVRDEGIIDAIVMGLVTDPNRGERELDVEGAWTLVPAEETADRPKVRPGPRSEDPDRPPRVRINPDPALRPAVERTLSVAEAALDVGPDPANPTPRLSVRFRYNQGPIGVAWAVALRPAGGGPEWAAGAVRFPAGGTGDAVVEASAPGLPGGAVDVILRPSPTDSGPEIREIWGGEVILRDVPVRRPGM